MIRSKEWAIGAKERTNRSKERMTRSRERLTHSKERMTHSRERLTRSKERLTRSKERTTFKDGVTGFKVTPNTGNAELLPLTLKDSVWNDLMTQAVTVGDNYTYDKVTGQVTPGPDGILELNLYPGSGAGQLAPGNFGTVDIGSNNNSTADLSRQILYGVNESDMAFHGGALTIPTTLNGDTGLSAGIKDELAAIKGKARAIPLFSTVSGPGNNAMYSITGFAGIRIMNVKLTGPMSKKEVIIQPAFVVDDSAMTGPGSGTSYFVYQPVGLSR